MILAAVLGGMLVMVAGVAGVAISRARAAAAERDRIAAEAQELRGRVDEQDEAHALLRGSEATYRALVEGAGDWIWACDADGTITFSNAAGAALLGHEDLVGRTLADLTYAEDRRALSTPGGWAGVVRRLHADGSLRTVDTRWAPLREGIGLCGIDRDLSAPPPAERPDVAIVRLPVVDGLRAVVGYEIVGDGGVLAGFTADALLALGAGRPVWVSVESDEPPALPRDRVVFQLAPDADPAQARKLAAAGYRLALDGFEGDSALLEHCAIVKVRAAGRDDDELRALIAGPAERGLELVATGVADADELTRCQVLGFSHFQGEFFARPGGKRGSRRPGFRRVAAGALGADRVGGVVRGPRADHRRRRRPLDRAAAPRQLGLLRPPA